MVRPKKTSRVKRVEHFSQLLLGDFDTLRSVFQSQACQTSDLIQCVCDLLTDSKNLEKELAIKGIEEVVWDMIESQETEQDDIVTHSDEQEKTTEDYDDENEDEMKNSKKKTENIGLRTSLMEKDVGITSLCVLMIMDAMFQFFNDNEPENATELYTNEDFIRMAQCHALWCLTFIAKNNTGRFGSLQCACFKILCEWLGMTCSTNPKEKTCDLCLVGKSYISMTLSSYFKYLQYSYNDAVQITNGFVIISGKTIQSNEMTRRVCDVLLFKMISNAWTVSYY